MSAYKYANSTHSNKTQYILYTTFRHDIGYSGRSTHPTCIDVRQVYLSGCMLPHSLASLHAGCMVSGPGVVEFHVYSVFILFGV